MNELKVDTEIFYEEIHSVEVLDLYAHLAARNHIAELHKAFDAEKLVGIGAKSDDKFVGLLLGWIESSRASLSSVFVSKDYRRKGIATRLVSLAEESARARGAVKIMASISPESNSAPIRGVLKDNNWLPPVRQRELTAHCGPEMRLKDAPWLKRNLSDSRVEVFPWHELTDEESKKLESVQASSDCWFPELLSPLIDNTNLHRPTSLGLRFDGEVIGWSITDRVDDGPIVFVTMFAKPTPDYPLAGLKMMQECAHRLVEISKTPPPIPLSCSIVDGNKFFEFMERRVFGYLDTTTHEVDLIGKSLHKKRQANSTCPITLGN